MINIKLDLAVGTSIEDKNWTNQSPTWGQILQQCSKPKITSETFADFLAGDSEFKTRAKDVGGFVTGVLAGGRRTRDAVISKQIVNLDADYTKPDFLTRVKASKFAYCYYSTHSHTKENPRYRVLVPLSRPVTALEYEPVARVVAWSVDIDNIDYISYNLNRLMFWPSVSSDMSDTFEFGCSEPDAPFADVESIIKMYGGDHLNWEKWPRSASEPSQRRAENRELGDPREKPGVVGAFCTVYGIHRCIDTFLSDIYLQAEYDTDRYQYVPGSGGFGFSVLPNEQGDDIRGYSFHSTDPASQTAVNSFDLYRLNKILTTDEQRRAEDLIPDMTARPSYKKMCEFALSIPEVNAVFEDRRAKSAEEEFGIHVPESTGITQSVSEVVVNERWREELTKDKKTGKYFSNQVNTLLVLNNDPAIAGCFARDEFTKKLVITKTPPWWKPGRSLLYSDSDDSRLRVYFATRYGITGRELLQDGLNEIAENASFHPVRNYLNSLSWDGVPRLEMLFHVFMGAEDSAYMRQISRKWFTAAVKRIFEPGTKFDNMIVFVGREGIGKSTLVKKLGGDWFSTFSIDLNHIKDAIEKLQGKWILEWAELASFKKSSAEAIKEFVSNDVDYFRPAYGRHTEEYRRQCIFMGSTNNTDFLNDPTGNRRFWPVRAEAVPVKLDVHKDLTEELRGQIWAEAVNFYRSGEPVNLSPEMEAEARKVQNDHTVHNPVHSLINSYLDWQLPKDWYKRRSAERITWVLNVDHETVKIPSENTQLRQKVCLMEIWVEVLNRNINDYNFSTARTIKDCLEQNQNWLPAGSPREFGGDYQSQRCFYRR